MRIRFPGPGTVIAVIALVAALGGTAYAAKKYIITSKSQIKPSVLVKGGDYTREQVVGHEVVTANGGDVVLVDVLPGHSTTSLVQRARENRA